MKNVIAVFAHNEAEKIVACLNSVKSCNKENLQCYVLANGCSDATCDLVKEYSAKNDFVSLVEIKIGDKSNAWNLFVHDISRSDGTHFFVDGDVEILPESLAELDRGLRLNLEANVAAAVPVDCGFSSRKQRESMLSRGGVAGNLYALSGQFVRRLRSNKVRLPIGLIGDDSWIGALAFWDLNPQGPWDHRKIIVCEDSKFFYKALSPFKFEDQLLHYKRKIRYSIRHFQNRMMHMLVKEHGLTGVPNDVADLYSKYINKMVFEFRVAELPFDLIALNRMRRDLRRSQPPFSGFEGH